MLKITAAAEQEFSEIRSFYHTLIDMMQSAQYKPAWEKGVYPSDEYLLQSLRKQELYVGRWDNTIAAAMILNHAANEGYNGVNWNVDAAPDEVSVIHALGVLPTFGGRGFAKSMVWEAISTARKNGQKALRLDVLSGNHPAEKLYTGIGFQYVKTVRMFYEDTGWTDFMLYEYVLQEDG